MHPRLALLAAIATAALVASAPKLAAQTAKINVLPANVTASTHDGNVPANTVDGNLSTRWSASGDPQWIQFDLVDRWMIQEVKIAFHQGNTRQSLFDVQVSEDGSLWTQVLTSRLSSGTSTTLETFSFSKHPGRYVRIVGHGNTSNLWNSYTEVEIHGIEVPPNWGKISVPGGNVTASANDGNVPANAVDGNLATRWSASGDPQWIQLDLGSIKMIDRVKIAFYQGNARQSYFDIQVSENGSSWTQVRTFLASSGTSTALEMFDFPDRTGRYVRIVGHGNSENLWNSYTEVEIWGYDILSGTPLAVAGVMASAHDGNVPANTIDNNLATRWSASGNPQWIRYDLGSAKTINYVQIAFYKGDERQSIFDIDISTDNSNWTRVLTNQYSSGDTNELETFDFADTGGRYLRITGHGNTSNLWNSYTEVKIFGVNTAPAATELTAIAATASADDGNVAANAIDGNLNTRWSASGDPQWIKIDVGSVSTIDYIKIAFFKGDERRARFDVAVSSNDSTWTTVLTNQESSGTSLELETFDFTNTSGRWVRITGHGNNINLWNSYSEVKVFGVPGTPAAPPTPTGLTANAVSSSQINVSWNASSGASGYDLERDGSVIDVGTSLSYSHTGLAASSNHSYRVRAKNSSGTSAWSTTVSATTQAAPSNLDPLGIKKLYKDSTRGSKAPDWFMGVGSWQDRIAQWTNIGSFSGSGAGTQFSRNTNLSSNVRMRINAQDNIGSCNSQNLTNKTQLTDRGYMYKASDWKNLEFTGYFKLTDGGSDTLGAYSRGASHNNNCGCEGTAYKGNLFYSTGATQINKEIYHGGPNVKRTITTQNVGDQRNKWFGYKFIIYNLDQNGTYSGTSVKRIPVKMEIWMDLNLDSNGTPKNNWVKVGETTDLGDNWGSTSNTNCGGRDFWTLSWGGPLVTIRVDKNSNNDPYGTFLLKYCSVREIDPVPLQ
jgi:hypothetical protein